MTILAHDQKPKVWILRSKEPAHALLGKWIEENEYGWSSYLATTQAKGLLVDSAAWRLQFVDDSVLACPRKKGCWIRKIRPEEYEYLLQTQPQ
ncbi:MAG: hypothetical protein V4582_25460 [Pseudomonadota bacterium]